MVLRLELIVRRSNAMQIFVCAAGWLSMAPAHECCGGASIFSLKTSQCTRLSERGMDIGIAAARVGTLVTITCIKSTKGIE